MFDVNKIREDFSILRRKINGHPLVYFDNAATSQKPLSVVEAMSEFYLQHNANVHRGVHTLSDEASEAYDKARRRVAGFIGANSFDEIIFTKNSTEGVNVVAFTWVNENVKKGDVVLVTEQEHHSNLVPWQMLCKRREARLRVIKVSKEGSLMIDEKQFDRKIKLVALSHVSNVLGVVNPIKDIVRLVRMRSPEAVILLDGSQSVGHIPVNVKSLGVDFLVFSAHKMLGPMGVGVLWGRKRLLDESGPFLFGGDMIGEVSLEKTSWNKLPNKLEAGTPDVAGVVGLASAIEYLQNLQMASVEKQSNDLTRYALEKLGVLEKENLVEIYGPQVFAKRVGIVSFNIVGVHAHDAAAVLDSFGIELRSGQMCAAPLVEKLGKQAVLRASFYIYNTKEEIEYFVSKLGEVRRVFV